MDNYIVPSCDKCMTISNQLRCDNPLIKITCLDNFQ